jgi:hypothetical protein
MGIYDCGFSIFDLGLLTFDPDFQSAQSADRKSPIVNHKWGLALPLFVARILANDAQHILALHDAAGLAKPFD